MSEEAIVNRVAKSPLVTLDMKDFHIEGQRTLVDISDQLFQGIALKEKDFRLYVKEHNWSQYENHYIAVFCSVDAIIPVWSYMLIATKLEPYAKKIVFGDLNRLEEELYQEAIESFDFNSLKDKKVVVKGCSDVYVPESAYVMVTSRLRPLASSIMYGEPCSTVPLYKRK